MKSIIFSILIIFTSAISAFAQNTDDKTTSEKLLRVAVMDPSISGNVFDEGTGTIVRELVSTALVETGKYSIIERSLIDKILKEQKFSNSGAVNEGQAVELGKLAGANKVIISVLSSYAKRGMLSLKMIDVKSASIENQKSKLVTPNDILDIITSLTYELIGETHSEGTQLADSKTKSKSVFSFLHKDNTEKKTKEKPKKEVVQSSDDDNSTDAMLVDATDANFSISLTFEGEANSKNPEARIYLDDQLIGEGTLNEGFSVNFEDSRPGGHILRIDWSGIVPSKTFKINTKSKRKYIFGYKKSGFGYEFNITN